MKLQNDKLTDRVEDMAELKQELKLTKKDVTQLTEANKKMEVDLENRMQIDTAIDYLRQKNQKVTNRCAELEAKHTESSSRAQDLDQ